MLKRAMREKAGVSLCGCSSFVLARLVLVSALALVQAGCGGSSGASSNPPPPPPNPLPSITSLSPSSASIGGADFTLTVNGTNFISASAVQWNGTTRTTRYVSATQLTSSITAADIAAAGTANVTVFNPTPGGGTSQAASFATNDPLPSVTSLSPPSVAAGGAAFTLTVSGSNFISTSMVQWNGSSRTTNYVSATQLTASITAADIATVGTATITVVNPAPGGGTSQALSFTTMVPTPSVAIALAPATIAPGSSATLTWSASNATTCTASGAWSGSQALSGTQTVTQSSIGNYTFSLSCTGTGGTGSNSASLLVTKVLASSYENKNRVGAPPVTLPTKIYNAFALADFFNDGANSLVVHTLEYNPNDPTTYQNYGHIHFYQQDQTGVWVDQTSTLLTDTTGCLHPRKALVADFNRDGRPDVFFACHGLDVAPFPGEQPHLLMSQPDGTYTNVTLSETCYCHGASAGDIDGDGFPDVLVADNTVAHTPYFLINHNGDGTFTQDFSRLPASLMNMQIFSAELIDFSGSGKYDVFLAGNEPGTTGYPSTEYGPAILPNDGSGKFVSTTPVDLLVGQSFGLTLDILFENGSVYLLKVDGPYTSSEIQKLSYPQLQGSVIYSHTGTYPNGFSWVDWVLPYQQQIVSQDASFGVSVPQ